MTMQQTTLSFRPVIVDFETFWSDTFTLRKLSMVEYIRSPEFKSFGASVFDPLHPTRPDKQPRWLNDREFRKWAKTVDWENVRLIAHNAAFDASILAWIYGITPGQICDTIGLARATIGPVIKSFSLDNLGEYLGFGGKLDKGSALMAVKGIREPSPQLLANLGYYAVQDAQLTWDIYEDLTTHNAFNPLPESEFAVMDWSLRCWVEPALDLDMDAIQAAREEEETRRFVLLQNSLAGDIRAIRSDIKFAELLEARGVAPAMKISKRTGKPAYAFAKSDPFMEELLNHEDPEVVALAEARVGLKTSIVQTRINSLATHAEANHGKFSVGLQYGAAHTHRLGGTGFAPKGALNITNFPRKGALNDAPTAPPGWLICNCDQSQIECRLVLWMAGEHQPLGMLARGEDLYSYFASIVFGRKIDKKKDPDQRFVGKVSVLSLGFGSGAPTFQNMVRVQGKQKLDDMFSQHVVKTYRTTYPGVPRLWRALDGVLDSMIAGKWVAPNPLPNHGITWVLGGDRPGFFTPNGLFVGYQGLTKRDGKYVYQRVNKSKSTEDAWIWGGTLLENCLAADTQVLTNRGWKRIADVASDDLVHDGVQWVQHSGVAYMGQKQTVSIGGVRMTPDHRVWQGEWVNGEHADYEKAVASCELNGPALWEAAGATQRGLPQQEATVGSPLRLRPAGGKGGRGTYEDGEARASSPLFGQVPATTNGGFAATSNPRTLKASNVRGLAQYARSLSAAVARCVGKLRRARHHGLPAVGNVLSVLGGHGAYLPAGLGHRSAGQQRRLLAEQLPVGATAGEHVEQADQYQGRYAVGTHDATAGFGKVGHQAVDAGVPDRQGRDGQAALATNGLPEPVYDVLNAGPRARFVVRGVDGRAFIVHNCAQSLARSIIVPQQMAINEHLRVVIQVYDSVVTIIPEDQVDESCAFITSVMSQCPEWAPGLPLACEAGVGRTYASAKDGANQWSPGKFKDIYPSYQAVA